MQNGKRVPSGLVLVAVFVLIYLFTSNSLLQPSMKEVPWSTFKAMVDDKKISAVEIEGNQVKGKGAGKDTALYRTKANPPALETLQHKLDEKKIPLQFEDPPDYSWVGTVLMLGIFIFFLLPMLRSAGGAGNKVFSFGRNKAKLVSEKANRTRFADVAGVDESVEECREIVEFLRDPKSFQKLGGTIPKGVLLMGDPGTGKTLLARAVAGEANVPFFSISGSDFVEMLVGVGASRVRDLFEQGKRNAPCIIFIDEIDAVGARRVAGVGTGGHDEREQTLNQLLVEMDGFEENEGVMIIAATNRPDVLDPALLRPGRFDRRVTVPKPGPKGRIAILEVHVRTKKIPLAADVDLALTARRTSGFTGAGLAQLLNEAALKAKKNGKDVVGEEELESARIKILMGGDPRKGIVMTEREKRATAVHEMGHTITGWFDQDAHPVDRVSIIPQGPTLGVTMFLPPRDQLGMTKEQLMCHIRVCVAGRVAEELVVGQVTTGAKNDFDQASAYARAMVAAYSMTEVGMQTYGSRSSFLGAEEGSFSCSPATARRIDKEVDKIIREAYDTVKGLLTDRRDLLEKGAAALLEQETLDTAQLQAILGPPVFREH